MPNGLKGKIKMLNWIKELSKMESMKGVFMKKVSGDGSGTNLFGLRGGLCSGCKF